uniref:Reverse transcriptase domain-containing protein n=1 Tax=Fagus sylvatica TaxID=28930 RepID=A0A2N9HFR8_FAGSY
MAEEENTETIRPEFPTGRVRRIMKLDKDINMVNSKGLFLVSCSAELFLHFLAEKSVEVTIEKKRKIVKLEHMLSIYDLPENVGSGLSLLSGGSTWEGEEVPFEFGPEEEIEKFYLAARFMTSRVLNIESVVRTFKPLWRAVHGFTARDMGNNMLVFVFEDVSDLERVLQSEPWSYDKHLVSFQRVEADTIISEMDCQWVSFVDRSFSSQIILHDQSRLWECFRRPFRITSFWVQIHNLPVRRMNHETASALGGTLGVVEKVVESEEERGREGCMRVRVKVDISKPLCRGRKARLLAGKETWIAFKYERLPNFCYWCGLLTHGDRECEKWLRSKGSLRREDQQYGAWLRASVERPIRRVEVKVIGRGSPKVAKPFMDFTQLKENLPNPDTAVTEDQSLPTKFAAPIPRFDPVTAVNEEQSMPTISAATIPVSDPSPAANHVESSLHSCAKSLPDSLQHDGSKGVELYLMEIQTTRTGRRRYEEMKGLKLQRWLGTRRRLWCSPAVPNESIKLELPGAWEPPGSSVPCLGRSGGLALLWNDPAQVTIQNFSQNHIDSHVQLVDGARWRFTGFYGHPEGHRKWESWVLMDKLHSLDNAPWLCMGDFNEILSLSERSGEFLGSTRRMQDFCAVVNRCGLIDLGFRGIPFTWENRSDGEALIQKRLDRALANAAWLDCFNLCSVSHMVCSYSDHVPLLLHMDTSTRHCQPKRRPRKFEEKWSLHPDCEAIIQDVWSREEANGSPMFILCEKIKHCRKALYRWYKEVSGEFQNKIKVHTTSLTSLISSNIAGQNNSAIASLKAEINQLLLSEELHWRQRSRMTWLAAGDSNTKFFHSQAQQRRRTNRLSGLWNSDNVWCTDENQIKDIAVSYFDDIFHTSTPVNLEDTLFVVNSRVTPFFFQKYWNIVGANVSAAVLSVLNSGKMLRKINLTHISLIPKKKNPERMSEYRPISLCNVVYKIISKVLANRLKVVLPCIISDSQSAFVPGRLITDNVSIAFEFIHKMKAKRKGKKGEMAIKLDMSKAYDRVEWTFIESLSALFQQSSAMGHLKGTQLCRGGPWGASNFDKYLGLPVMIGRSKKSIFNGLKERIVHRLQGWKERFLSKAGREVLIKVVAQAIPTYAMNCFRLPKAWCEEVNSLIARYWWGQKKEERKLHWIKWDKLCTAKAEGVKSAYEMLERERSRSATGECSYLHLRWLWRKTWKLAIPGKIKHFLWRAYHETLPTNHQLHRRKIRSSSLCSVCDQKEETTFHALWQCPLARNMWALIHCRMQKLSNQDGEFSSFMQWILKEFPKEEVEDWAIIAWSIWNARNRFVHEDCQVPPQTIRANALAIRYEFNQARLSFQH